MSGIEAKSGLPPELAARALGVVEFHRSLRLFIRCTFGCIAIYLAYRAIDALAGRATSVQIDGILQVFADFRFVLSFALAGAGGVWALLERRNRQRTVERLHTRITELETQLDPQRSSSGLTAKGKTNPRDKGQ